MDGAERWRILRLHVEDEIPLAELARETKVSLRTLERWHRSFQEGGIAALDPRPRRDAGTRRTTAETVAFIERLALTRPRPSLATLHRLAVADADDGTPRPRATPPSETSCTPWTPALVTLALEGPASYRDRHELVYRRRAERPNQIWQADHTELDILIIGADGKPDRPWLTTVMDDYSRAICGYTVFTGAPSALNTALALRQAIWRKTDPAWAMCGIPDILHVDHGSDFTSHHLERTAIDAAHPHHPLHRRPAPRPRQDRAFLRHHQHRTARHPPRAPRTRHPHTATGARPARTRPRDRGLHRHLQRPDTPRTRHLTPGRLGRRRLAAPHARQPRRTRRAPPHRPEEPHRATRRHPLPRPALPRAHPAPHSSGAPSPSATTPATSPRSVSTTTTPSSASPSTKPTRTSGSASATSKPPAAHAAANCVAPSTTASRPLPPAKNPESPNPRAARPRLRTYEEDE